MDILGLTLNRFSHVLDSMRWAAMDTLDQALATAAGSELVNMVP